MMGRRQQDLGPSFVVHKAFFKNMRNSKNSIVVVENVPEYSEALVQRELGCEWALESVRLDPRVLGLPTSRARVFMLCWKKNEVLWNAPFTLTSFIHCLRSRVVMNAGNYFFLDLPKTKLTPAAAPFQQSVP